VAVLLEGGGVLCCAVWALNRLPLLCIASCPVIFLFVVIVASSGSGCCGNCTAGLACNSAGGVTLAGTVVVVSAWLSWRSAGF
jgi:hypothetical protein